jgi:hypothetical protein
MQCHDDNDGKQQQLVPDHADHDSPTQSDSENDAQDSENNEHTIHVSLAMMNNRTYYDDDGYVDGIENDSDDDGNTDQKLEQTGLNWSYFFPKDSINTVVTPIMKMIVLVMVVCMLNGVTRDTMISILNVMTYVLSKHARPTNISRHIKHSTIRKVLGLQKETFLRYAMCGKCSSLHYPPPAPDSITDTTNTCMYVRFLDNNCLPCGTLLYDKFIIPPKEKKTNNNPNSVIYRWKPK